MSAAHDHPSTRSIHPSTTDNATPSTHHISNPRQRTKNQNSGKHGNAARLLAGIHAATTTDIYPDKISIAALRVTPAISPARIPARFRQCPGNISGKIPATPWQCPGNVSGKIPATSPARFSATSPHINRHSLAAPQSAKADFVARSAFRRGFNRPLPPPAKPPAVLRQHLRQYLRQDPDNTTQPAIRPPRRRTTPLPRTGEGWPQAGEGALPATFRGGDRGIGITARLARVKNEKNLKNLQRHLTPSPPVMRYDSVYTDRAHAGV